MLSLSRAVRVAVRFAIAVRKTGDEPRFLGGSKTGPRGGQFGADRAVCRLAAKSRSDGMSWRIMPSTCLPADFVPNTRWKCENTALWIERERKAVLF